MLDTPELYDTLKDAMIERDFPGMADVDSSYLLLFEKLKKYKRVALSGECSDEIFGGYPWYFKNEEFNTFPWSTALDERQKLLRKDISRKINIEEYVREKYNSSLKNVEFLEEDSIETIEHRKLIYLTSNWFMNTLLDRTDRMSKYSNVEVRVPFCDYRLVEYVWNIPWEMKAYKGREKGLLRKAMEGYLPDEIIYRKKSPYPKTHNPNYLKKVKEELIKIVENKNSRIYQLVDIEYVKDVIKTDGKNFKKPWFGQLMTGPQFMAYLIQLEFWLDLYDIKIDI
jgi:asparagine synthase (glutamine-hydrolysing)